MYNTYDRNEPITETKSECDFVTKCASERSVLRNYLQYHDGPKKMLYMVVNEGHSMTETCSTPLRRMCVQLQLSQRRPGTISSRQRAHGYPGIRLPCAPSHDCRTCRGCRASELVSRSPRLLRLGNRPPAQRSYGTNHEQNVS